MGYSPGRSFRLGYMVYSRGSLHIGYLPGISVNEDVINAPNPLLVVNHKTNIVMPNAHRMAPVSTVIEGSHVSRIPQLLQGYQGASI